MRHENKNPLIRRAWRQTEKRVSANHDDLPSDYSATLESKSKYTSRDCLVIASANLNSAREALNGVYVLHNGPWVLPQLGAEALHSCGVILDALDQHAETLARLIGSLTP